MYNSEPIIAGKEESAEFITQLNRKLTEEHRQIIQQIEADLELRGRSKDGQTDREDTVSVTSEPVTSAEKKAILNKAEDVQRSLAAQVEEIESLRARMLNEYQQMLSVRAEVMSSQSAEVEQLQREMETIQRDYAGQMDEFETKVKQQTESAVRSELGSSHARDLEEMKTYYEAKEHAELLSRLQQENGGSDLPSTVHMSPGKHRDYVRHTTTLTAISDEDESPPSTPTPGTTPTGGGDDGMIENRLRTLESKLKDKEKIIDQLKKRVEAETTSAEDLHGKLLDSNKTLEDMEESLKSRADEIEDLKKELAEKVEKIIDLESEKAALEEKGEKDTGVSESGDKILAELRERIKTLENELSASKETNAKIKDEINKMSYEHGEAIVKMKEEMENLNIIKIEELEAGFKIQLEEELQQQAEELDNKMQDELRQQAEELNVFKQTESELKQKLDEIQTEHEKQLNELKEKYESESQGVVEPTIEVQETMEVQMVSPTETMDRESLEATLREELKAEILKEYEDSIDSLKNEYEERISDLNTKLQSLETKEKIESSESEDESDIKEKLRVEIAQEFKDKLQNVTDEYETKLKHLQGILDSKKESERKENEATTKQLTQSSPPYVLARSRSLDRMPSQDRSKLPADYEGFVSTIRKGYEDRINSLQREIAQYKSSVGPVPLSPLLSLTSKAQVVSSSTTDSDRTKALKASPDSVTGSSVAVSPQLRQQVYDEIHAEFQASYDQLKEDYEAQLEELTDKLNALQSDSATQGDIENKISEEYEEQIEKLKAEYEEKIAELKLEYEEEVSKLNTELEKSKSDKLAAEKKVKADMFVWHEEVTSQMKHKHDEAISAMRKEYEEKMELYQEELQEDEETLDAELSRLGEEKDLEIEEQRAKYEAQMVELRESLLQQYQAQLAEAESSNQAAIQALQDNLEAAELAQGVSESASEKKDTEKDTGVDSGEYLSDLKRTHEIGLGSQGEAVRSTASIDSTKMDEGEKDEEEEDVDTTGAGGRYRDGDDDTDGGAGGAKVTPNSTQDNKDLQVEQHDISHEQDGDQPDTTTGEAVGDTVAELRQQLEKKHAEEIRQLTEELSALEGQHMEEEAKLQHSHEVVIATLNEEIENLREGEATEALELAHQQELSDLENRLVHKHMNELNNAQTQYQSKLDSLHKAHAFHGEITEGQDEEDFMARESLSSTDSEPKSEPFQAHQPSDTIETQAFEAQAEEEITESSDIGGASLGGTLEGIGVVSLDTSVDPATLADTSLDQSRGTLRGVDTTADTELIHFSEEEDEETSETDRSMQDDSSLRGTDREELQARLEAEVIDLRARLGAELERQGDTLERIDREKQEERNLTAMLREDIERLNGDREAMQTTNEHLLSLLSDSVKTYMTVDEGITRRMKTMMEKSGVKVPAPGSGKRTPPPGKKSPSASPGRLSPARAEDADNLQETSILSNITDEGLDLSQRICDSIFQGPDLASEEEELLIDSGSRLRTSVTHLLEVLEETTSQLLDTRSTQAQLADTVEGTGHDLSSLMARCADLEDRLREEVERKDFLALELHKAEGLIEGYVSERETLELKIGDLEEQKETLVLSLETTKNKLHDLESMKSENEKLRQEMKEQRELMTSNVGDEAQALLLEVDRLNSENREREEQVRTTHERYEYRVRELETSGEDMEHHYGKLLDDKKQEVADLRLQEQSAEREQEHEEYQREIEKWRKNVHDLEKHNGSESRLQTDVDELTEQLQARIDLHETAIQESDRLQKSLKERDLSVRELKTLNEQFDLDLQEKSLEVERLKEKLSKLEATLGTGDFQDDELSDSGKSEARPQGPADSIELSGIEGRNERSGPHMTVEEEIRQAADKTKEELVREKFTLQCAVNDNLVQLSSLRNQLDEMRHRRGIGEPTDSEKRLDAEREKSEEKDKQISELNLEIEELKETLGNRDQQIEQLREQRARHRTSPTESVLEYERDRDTERQLEALNRENKQLKERLKLAEASFAGDMSGLSQGLIEEKNAEIDQLSDQLSRLQADLADIKAERGVEHLHNELEALREEVSVKDREIMELQSSVRVSAAFTDNSLTPDSSLLNVGASFTDKASIAQEMEETVTARVAAGLEAEVQSLKSQVQTKEDLAVSLETELAALKEELAALKEELATLKEDEGLDLEEASHMQASIAEKEGMIGQLTAEIKHEVEIARLKRDLREKDNVVEEKLEELAELSDKVELLESHIAKYKEQVKDNDEQILEKDKEIKKLRREIEIASEDEKSRIIQEQKEELENLKEQVQKLLGRPPSPPKSEDEIDDAVMLGRPPSPPGENFTESKADVITRLRVEIEKLKQQIMDANLTEDDKFVLIRDLRLENETLRKQIDAALKIRPPSPPMEEDEKTQLIHEQRREIEVLRTQVETGVPRTEDEASQVIRKQEKEIVKLKKQVEAALQIAPPLPPMSEDEKDNVIEEKEMEVQTLKKELSEVKLRLDSLNSSSATSLQESVQEKEVEMSKKENKLKEAEERVKKLEEALEDAKEVKAYEDEIELKEKQDEIEELQAELETYRSREESSLSQSLEMDKTDEKSDPKQLVRSMSFYKEQYEDKCSETRQLQVQIDLIKQQLENANSEKLEDAQEEVELFRAENEQLRAKTEIFEKEREELKRELTFTRERQGKTDNEQIESLEKELQLTKDELARERLDTVEAINDLEHLRERKERERRGSLKTIQELEQDLEEKMAKEKQLNIQIKQLNEELTVIKRQYGIEDKGTGAEARTSPKSLQLRSQGSFELSNDVEILQEQVIQFKQHADKAKEILGEKQKYQSQLVKLEIQHEQLQKTMKKEVSKLEEQLKSFKTQPDKDVWTQLHATQDRLEKTSDQLAETGLHLAETESSLKQVSADLAAREDEMRGLQQDLWKTSSQLSATSTKLQETEERLRQALGQVSEREDQILHLQGEVQHPPAEQSGNISPQEVERLQDQLRSRDQELEQTTQEADRLRAQLADTKKELDEVGKSLREAVEMGEQQMSVAESKDQEFVQLKLDIQASMQEKDKLIREQKNQLKEKEKEMKKLQQDVEQRQKEVIKVTEEANKAKEEVAQTRQSGETTTIATLRAQLQKVMSLKDELSSEHQRHISELTRRASQDTEAQLAALRIKYTDEIEHLKRLHGREVDEKLHDQLQKLERKYKAETNRLVVKHQEEITALKSRAGLDFDESSVHEREARQRQDGVGAEMGLVNGHGAEPMSAKLQGILRKLHREGVQVLTISELEYLNRSQSSASLPRDADVESLRAGWENERQSMISTIQALKDLLAQTHKLRGLDKSLEGSDWRAELLRAISYVFTKERETLLAQLRSHVLAFPETNIDEVQRLEQKIRNMESQHQSAQEQIFSADRQSLLAELRDLRAHATIARLQQQEERDRLHEKLAHAEDNALKKERQLKRQVQLLEFKIQQEKVLQEDLRTSLDTERHNTSDLSGQLSREKVTNLDLQTAASTLQGQVAKLREGLEREQSRYELRSELQEERDRRCAAESQHEIDAVTVGNLQQEVDMTRRHQHAVEAELSAKVNRLQQALINEEQRQADTARALERERALIQQLQQSLDSEREAGRDRVSVSEVTLQLEAERASMEDTRAALARETRAREDVEGERRMLKEHLGQERQLNEEIKHELDKVQFERLEAINSLQKERDLYARMKGERDALTEEVRTVRTRESEREHRREEERLQGRQSAREVDRDREESRIKLREQELEVQRLSKKASRLEDQLATSQEHELRAVRDLEKLRLEVDEHQSHHDNMVSAQTSPRRGEGIDSSMDLDTSEQREKMSVYRSQLESMCQSLHYLVLRCREQLNMASHSGSRSGESSDYNVLQRSLRDLLSEVKQLQELEGGFMTHPSSTVNERVLRHNEELTNYAMQRTNEVSDHQILSERADWAKERLSLQMALTSAEREIGLLQTDLRVERERRVAAGNTETKDTDKVKIQRLYGKFLRAESFRKALVYQKKYLLLLLGGFQDTEETTLALLSRMGAVDSRQRSSLRDNARPLTKFRGAVRVVIAIQRMRFLVKKWRRATRVGSEVVGGSVDQSNGYVPNAASYSPPRNGHASRVTPGHARSSSSPPTHTAYRHMSPARTASPAIARTASPAREYNGTSDHHHARGPVDDQYSFEYKRFTLLPSVRRQAGDRLGDNCVHLGSCECHVT
ncbi:PCNT-like protein [Mya arenaria]|uniref:PCNT-like protein n=1 Tax=Mya arenaria TaxID=6604 RepID=A0ABY7DDW7_MYAAR|nr:PCNT-like protein [Mya arenaria]